MAALAVLALTSSASTEATTAQVRKINEGANQWTQLLVKVSDEYEALNDYMRADTDVGRQPLINIIGSATNTIAWLKTDSVGDNATLDKIVMVKQGYSSFTQTLTTLVESGRAGDHARVELLAEEAGLNASALRKQVTAELTVIHDDQNVYLDQVRQRNRRLRLAETLTLILDAALLAFCSLLLLAHQRRMERQAESSSHQALHDGLTGIPNRVLLQDRLTMALRDADRTQETSALLLLDLDRFKEVNDTLGHHYGDLLLCEVARRLTSVVREGDTVARLGGDEFAILLRRVPGVNEVLVIAERALEALRGPADLQGQIVMIGGSIGVVISPDHSTDAGELFRFADIAMYEAKRRSAGVLLYQPASATLTPARVIAASELAAAIEAGQLVLHYQPKLHLQTGRVIGMEALVRWQHPERGLLFPDAFIPLAEQSDLILSLTDKVLNLALAEQRGWAERGWGLTVAVNVGVRSLLVHDLAERITEALARHGSEPSDLVLEITESAFIADISRAIDLLGKLRDLGVRISIDDFGTGYSSMTYLQALPADELKIDRGFVGTNKGSRSEAILRATLQLGHSLGLYVTAEGVEDEETLTMLTQMGCDLAQGYHICRPISGPQLVDWLHASEWQIGPWPMVMPEIVER
jgi:diguanylate cyclase (GGDEF)-like protein